MYKLGIDGKVARGVCGGYVKMWGRFCTGVMCNFVGYEIEPDSNRYEERIIRCHYAQMYWLRK